VQMFLAAAFLGLGAAGILRAMLLPASVMTQVVTAAGLLVLPGFSYDFGQGLVVRMRQKAMILSGVLCGAGICFSVLLWMVAGRAEHLLFGGKYAMYAWLMPVLSLVPAVNGLTMGFSMALRASQRPHLDLLANAIAAPIAVASALSFIRWWGLAGAAASMVIGFAVYMGVNCWAFSATDGLELKSKFAGDGGAR
jgi:O-antigen/teichoic acid export membrane protein